MRLLAHSDARGRGGAEHSLGHLLAHLPVEVEVHVAGPDAAVVRWLAARRPGAAAHLVDGLATVRLARTLRPDVVHVNRCTPWAGRAGLLAGLATPGCRVTLVDQLPLRAVHLPELLAVRALTRRVDAAVAVGEASARRMEDFYALGRGSVTSIPNYVPDPGLPVRRPHDGPLRLLAVGRLDRMKGHDVLLDALAAVPGPTLTILGEGAERAALSARAAGLGLDRRVRLPGWSEDVAGELAAHDVLVMPSRSEGWPLAVVEAMLAGLPVVATSVGSIPEAVQDGVTGLLVPSDDSTALAGALRALRDDPATRQRLGAAGREFAAGTMTAEQMAAAWLRLWDRLRARPRAPRGRPARPTP